MASVVLAYTGGTHSSVASHWLQNRKGLKVFTFAGNFGGIPNQEVVCERALAAGAAGAHIGDLRKRFLLYFAFPALRAGARFGSGYFLSRALSRPLIVEEIAKIARENGCEWVAHCSPPDSNDFYRFRRLFRSIAPHLKLITPWTEWAFDTRQEVCDYADRHGLPVMKDDLACSYQVDKNIWGSCIEFGPEDDPWAEPPEAIYSLTQSLEHVPDTPVTLEIDFRSGNPVGLDGERLDAVPLVLQLNSLAAAAGIGRAQLIKENLSGAKGRFLYEAPGATLLYQAHEYLEQMTLEAETLQFKREVTDRFTRIIHEGQWYSPLRRALDAFLDETQVNVTGTVRVKLLRGRCTPVGVRSDHALYTPRSGPAPLDHCKP